jgi:hypothetical protein
MSKKASAFEDDDDRDTLVSNYLSATDQPPLVIELCVEVPRADQIADPAERVLEALSQSLKALGWRPTVLCAKRSPESLGAEEATLPAFRASS